MAKNGHEFPGLPRGWVEFIGIILLSTAVAGLAFLSGVAPILELPRVVLGDIAIRLVAIALIGATLLSIALQQEGRRWYHIVIVPMIIIAIALSVIFIPLWAYFSYLEAKNPFEYFRLMQ